MLYETQPPSGRMSAQEGNHESGEPRGGKAQIVKPRPPLVPFLLYQT